MDNNDGRTAEVIRDLAINCTEAKWIDTDNPMAKVVKKMSGDIGTAYEVLDLEKHMPTPNRIREKVELGNAESFILYVEQFKEGASPIVFFDDVAASFGAVLDYASHDQPRWGDHAASFVLRRTPEFKAWADRHGKEMSQVAFGQFIEDHTDDILTPAGAALLDMVMTFEATKTATFKSSQRLKDGRVRFQYNEELKSDSVEIPDVIKLFIPVYIGQQARSIDARIRYRIEDGGKLKIWFDLLRWERIIQEAQEDIIAAVRVGTSLPVFIGKRNTPAK